MTRLAEATTEHGPRGGGAVPLRASGRGDAQHVRSALDQPDEPMLDLQPLTPEDFRRSSFPLLDRIEAAAYRAGLMRLFDGGPRSNQLVARVEGAVPGNRAAGQSLRTGHLAAGGLRTALDDIDYRANGRLVGPVAEAVHGFAWLRDLAAVSPAEDTGRIARDLFGRWTAANSRESGRKGLGWKPGVVGARLLAWLVHAPLILGEADSALRKRYLAEIDAAALWLDRAAARAKPGLWAIEAWSALAAQALLRQARARLRFAEIGLLTALGDGIGEDGGILSRSPADQLALVETLTDLAACYASVDKPLPSGIETIRAMLLPPLLALRHGDGGLGNWQGSGGIREERVARARQASGVRARAVLDASQWGYRTLRSGDSIVQFDAAPPPAPRYAASGCASTLAFELSHGAQRLVVNCGGAALAGGALPMRIEQGVRGTAAHSTLVLDDANSTAVLLKGAIGKGVAAVEVARDTAPGRKTVTASHDGYASRFALLHERALSLRDDGLELAGEDRLIPSVKNARRGKVQCALRFHCGPDVQVEFTAGARQALLALPDGGVWRFALDGPEGTVSVEDSLWVDGEGRPHPTRQLVVEGLASRSGETFAWRFVKMG